MKTRIRRYAQLLREGLAGVVRLHPVELLIALYGCAGCIMTYELDWDDALPKLALAPLFFALAFVVNNLAGRGPWRRVYWVIWAPMVPLTLWTGLEAWLSTPSAWITFGVLVPLAVLASRLALRNDRFVGDGIVYLRAGVLALLFANVALGLFYAIFYSTIYIFGLQGRWVDHVAVYAVTLAQTVGVPVLFLMMADRWRDAVCRGNRVVEVLLNYIVTPALLIYAAILYLYMAKILLTWTLPEGGVAYPIFGFTLFSLTVAALQFLLAKRLYDWFFDRMSLVLLPAQVLFWIGVVRRTGEYGMTEPRVYLVVCGALMTLCVVLFFSRRTGRYFYVCLAGLLCFGALAYIPSLRPERIAVRSQLDRAVRVAERLERLDDEGRLLLKPLLLADTARRKEYRKLYESLDYIRRDSAAFARFGMEDLDDFAAIFPDGMREYVKWGYESYLVSTDERSIGVDLPSNASFEVVPGYSRYYTNLRYWDSDTYSYENDTLRLWLGNRDPVAVITGGELLRTQLEKSGFVPAENAVPTDEQVMQLLDYRSERFRILFERLNIERGDSCAMLYDLTINSVWTR